MELIDRYKRTKIYDTAIVDGITERDLLLNKFRDFKFIRQPIFYTIREEDVQRPDLISFKFFNKKNYWWIILSVNNIGDVWNELIVGETLKIPHKLDIEDFFLNAFKK